MAIGRLALCGAIWAFAQVLGGGSVHAEDASNPPDISAPDLAKAASPAAAQLLRSSVGADAAATPSSASPVAPVAPAGTEYATAATPPAMTPTAPPPAAGPAAIAATTPNEVTIWVVVGSYHSDVVIPRTAFKDAPPLIRAAVDKAPDDPWIIVGWGPWWFGRDAVGGAYHPIPIRLSVGLWSLVVPQTHSQLRVAALAAPGAAPGEASMFARPIQVSAANLDRLIKRLDASFKRGRDGRPVLENYPGVKEGVGIYRSKEVYHLAHECNQWTAEVLRAGGIKSTYILDLLPMSLYLDLKVRGAKSPRAADVAQSPAR